MPIDIADFHYIRAELLWLLVPLVLLVIGINQQNKQQSAWRKVISPHLLEFLFMSGNKSRSRSGLWITTAIAAIAIIAISGPTFRQKPVPVFQTDLAQVILMDLSLSMDATDIKPSRLDRARFKLLDLLEQTKEGTVALVVYAGDAFVISPLTSDAKTVANMVPTLSTGIMPVLGSRPDLGIEKSIQLLKNAKYNRGQIIWLTDGVDAEFVESISQSIEDSNYNLSILAIGTEQGAPIPLPNKNGFLKDNSGAIVVPKLQLDTLNEIAANTESGIIQMTADGSDIDYLGQARDLQKNKSDSAEESDSMFSSWIDDGHWLIWPILLLMLIKLIRQPANSFNSLFLVSGLLMAGTTFSPKAAAVEWQDLWLTKDQQANQAYQQGNFEQAAKLYQDPNWRATSQFRNGDFGEAAQSFDPKVSEQSLYNHATSLAKANQLQESLDAYNQLLEKSPQHEDALHNKQIVEDLLKQQQEQQSEQDSNEENQQNQEQDSEQQDSQQQDQKESEQEQSQQQDSEQQEQEQQQQQQEVEVTEDERDKSEKDQALEHWLEKIPDDPGGLLRRKMYREYQRRGRQQKEEKLW